MKRVIALFLSICLLMAMLPLSASAADVKAKDVAQAYQQVLRWVNTLPYGVQKAVVLRDLCGDALPELIAFSQSQQNFELQVWTYGEGEARKVLSRRWMPVAASRHYLYQLPDGRLAEYYCNAGYNEEYSREERYGAAFSQGSDGAFGESGSWSYFYYQYHTGGSRFDSGEINGAAAGESAVKARESQVLAGALLFSDDAGAPAPGVMTLQEAKTKLDGIVGSFFDVPAGQYYTQAVEWAVSSGITAGTGAGHFSPNQNCTRAQAVTFLWRAVGSPRVSSSVSFRDVSADAYYAEAVKWAAANGITGGTGNGRFSPNSTCTRAQIVSFLYRAAGSPAGGGADSFADVAPSAYYAGAVKWAAANSVTRGTGNGKFSPDAACTRGQIVTFLYKAADLLRGEPSS